MEFLFVCSVLATFTYLCSACEDYIIKNKTGVSVNGNNCVSNVTCLQTKEFINVSWMLPHNNSGTLDFIISVITTQTGETEHSGSLNTSSVTYMHQVRPVSLEFNYRVIVNRRYSRENGDKAYSIGKDCKKLFHTVTTKNHNTSQWTKKGQSRREYDKTTKGISYAEFSSEVTYARKEIGTPAIDWIKEEKEGNTDNGKTSAGSLYIIIGASTGGCLVFVVAVVIMIRKRLTGNRPMAVHNTTNEANNDPENVYNHLSQDARDRASREQTNNYEDEEDTYNRLTLRYRDKNSKPEPASNAGCPQQPATTDAPQSLQFGTNYDKVSINNRTANEAKSVTVKEASEDSDELMQKDHKKDDLDDLSTNDEYASVNKHNSSQIDTNLDRKEGPKGDLYTSVSIKR